MTIERPLRNLDEGIALGSELTSSLRASGLWRSLAAINLLAIGATFVLIIQRSIQATVKPRIVPSPYLRRRQTGVTTL